MFDHDKVIYTPTLASGIGGDSIPLMPEVPDYVVTGSSPTAGEAGGRSLVVHFTANNGVNLGSFEFKYDDLRVDSVLVRRGHYESVPAFRSEKAVNCR